MIRDTERSDLRACLIQSLQLNPCVWSRAQGAKRPRHDKTPFSLTALATCLYIVNRYSILLLWLRHLFLKCKHAALILNTMPCAVVRTNSKVCPRKFRPLVPLLRVRASIARARKKHKLLYKNIIYISGHLQILFIYL